MDNFCIDRGTLFDNKDVDTLGPEGVFKHTVHCLMDVPSCVASPWEILHDASLDSRSSYDEGERFGRSFRLDSNVKLMEYARNVGVCDKGCTGDTVRGLTGSIVGEVTSLGSRGMNVPAIIKVSEVLDATTGCENVGDDVITEFEIPLMLHSGGDLNTAFLAHGSLMLIAWGFLLPSGAIIAKFFKHRPDGLWFKIHRVCQMTGLVLGIIGFIIALVYSSALQDKGSGSLNYPHAVMGVTVMTIGMFQPLNAFFRPKHVEGAQQSTERQIFEFVHKGLGWGVIVLAAVTIGIGTTLLSTKEQQRTFQVCYGALIGGLLLLLLVFVCFDKKKYEALAKNEPEEEEQP